MRALRPGQVLLTREWNPLEPKSSSSSLARGSAGPGDRGVGRQRPRGARERQALASGTASVTWRRRPRSSSRSHSRRAHEPLASTIARPRPVPSPARDASRGWKRSNAWGRNAGGNPAPSSETERSTCRPRRASSRTVPDPWRRALSTRFPRACLESYPVARERRADRRRHLDRTAACTARAPLLPGDGLEQLTLNVVTLHPQLHAPVVRTRERQQILGEPHEPLDLLAGGAQRGVELLGAARTRTASSSSARSVASGVRARGSHRRRTGASFQSRIQSIEHLVERLAEPVDLVPRPWERETCSGASGRSRRARPQSPRPAATPRPRRCIRSPTRRAARPAARRGAGLATP